PPPQQTPPNPHPTPQPPTPPSSTQPPTSGDAPTHGGHQGEAPPLFPLRESGGLLYHPHEVEACPSHPRRGERDAEDLGRDEGRRHMRAAHDPLSRGLSRVDLQKDRGVVCESLQIACRFFERSLLVVGQGPFFQGEA